MGHVNSLALFQMLSEDLGSILSPEQIRAPDIWPDATLKQRTAYSLAKSLLKKCADDVKPNADDVALQKFQSVNSDCASWSLRLENSWDEVLVGELKRSLDHFFYPEGLPLLIGLDQFFDRGRNGPGASLGSHGNDFYTKLFSSPLSSCKSSLLDHYRRSVRRFPKWLAAEQFRASLFEEDVLCEGSKFHFVPKTNDVSRLICIEPTLNMFYQLGLGAVLEDRLRQVFGIDLSRQPELNRELARIGSITGTFCTIDLSSASDSLGLPMLTEFLPREVLSWLNYLRSPVGFLGQARLELNMISTMGNGYTFPLETVFFSCIVSACMRARGVTQYFSYDNGRRAGNFAVFGDDIIVDKRCVRDVLRLLHICGFTVNAEKTFVEGPFRESCGSDFFQGQNVRGVYLKTLRTMQSRYVAINELNMWSTRTGIYLPRTLAYLLGSVKRVYIPAHESSDAGIRVPLSFHDLYPKFKKDTWSWAYKAYVPRTLKLEILEDEVRVPRGSKKRIFNPDGLELSFIAGYIRSSSVTLRHKPLRYSMKWRRSSCWDQPPFGSPETLGEGFGRRWKTAVYVNTLLA